MPTKVYSTGSASRRADAESSTVQGRLLRSMRKLRGLNQADAAARIGFSTSKLSRMESGSVRASTVDLEEVLGVYKPTDDEIKEIALSLSSDGSFDWTAVHPELNSFNKVHIAVVEALQKSRFRDAFSLIELLEQLATTDEERGLVQLRRGSRHTGLGNFDEALRHLNDAEEYFTRCGNTRRVVTTLINKAVVALDSGRPFSCVALSKQVLAIVGEDEVDTDYRAWAQCNLARAGAESGSLSYDEQKELIEAAIKGFECNEGGQGGPDSDWARIHRAWLHARAGENLDEAAACFETMMSRWGPAENPREPSNYAYSAMYLANHPKMINTKKSAALTEESLHVAERNHMRCLPLWAKRIQGAAIAAVLSTTSIFAMGMNENVDTSFATGSCVATTLEARSRVATQLEVGSRVATRLELRSRVATMYEF